MKNQFVTLTSLVMLFLAVSCSSETENLTANLAFTIQTSDDYAPTQINVTNNSTNYSGNYKWGVTYSALQIFDSYTSENLNLNANRIGTYTFTLMTEDGSLELEKSVEVLKPRYLSLNSVTLTEVSDSYNEVYFKIKKSISGGSVTTYYTSASKSNITPLSVGFGGQTWNIESPVKNLIITDGQTGFTVYQIEFYDGNDNLISKMEGFATQYDEFSIYENEVKTVVTSLCPSCDYTEAELDLEFHHN